MLELHRRSRVREAAVPDSRRGRKATAILLAGVVTTLLAGGPALGRPTIEELKSRTVLDDYESNVLFGYNVVTDTHRYAGRYAGNALRCANCHLAAGTRPHGLPLNVAGVYPKWRAKNGVSNGLSLRIRECFLYSLNGVMPPDEAPEVQAVAAYIHFLSEGQIVGRPPEGASVPTLPDTGEDPNPARGEGVYHRVCAACHGPAGQGTAAAPPLWGGDAYNRGAGMNNVRKAAGFIWANMPVGNEKSLAPQEALDVSAFLNLQLRPLDPREGRLRKLVERVIHRVTTFFDAPPGR